VSNTGGSSLIGRYPGTLIVATYGIALSPFLVFG
jgi:hypothetical protein